MYVTESMIARLIEAAYERGYGDGFIHAVSTFVVPAPEESPVADPADDGPEVTILSSGIPGDVGEPLIEPDDAVTAPPPYRHVLGSEAPDLRPEEAPDLHV